jgi:RNA polymerase sigma factor (TIGR02999 family)
MNPADASEDLSGPGDVSLLLAKAAGGDSVALDELITKIHNELRMIAGRQMNGERIDHTWGPSALVNETLLKLLGKKHLEHLKNRRMLFAAAARAMRQTLIDHARSRQAARHGGGWRRTAIDDVVDQFRQNKVEIDDLHEALEILALTYPRPMQVIDLRFFGGHTIAEIAELLEASKSTIEKDLALARDLLRQRLSSDAHPSDIDATRQTSPR